MNHSKNREISHLGSGFMNLKPLEQCITPLTFFKHILEILSFAGKNENLAGLQLADFIPNTMARSAARMPPKHDSFKQTVLRQAYNGGVGLRDKYGFKVIPQRYSVP